VVPGTYVEECNKLVASFMLHCIQPAGLDAANTRDLWLLLLSYMVFR
jgi:hypothetical protein